MRFSIIAIALATATSATPPAPLPTGSAKQVRTTLLFSVESPTGLIDTLQLQHRRRRMLCCGWRHFRDGHRCRCGTRCHTRVQLGAGDLQRHVRRRRVTCTPHREWRYICPDCMCYILATVGDCSFTRMSVFVHQCVIKCDSVGGLVMSYHEFCGFAAASLLHIPF